MVRLGVLKHKMPQSLRFCFHGFFFIFLNKEFMQGHPRIKGPKSTADRIAIIGAGPSGMHMAYELKVYTAKAKSIN